MGQNLEMISGQQCSIPQQSAERGKHMKGHNVSFCSVQVCGFKSRLKMKILSPKMNNSFIRIYDCVAQNDFVPVILQPQILNILVECNKNVILIFVQPG